MVSQRLRDGFRFHLENGGTVSGQRAACALRSARAEIAARAEGIEFIWEDDCDDWKERQEYEEDTGYKVQRSECCRAVDTDGNTLASLCGIWDAGDDYKRVVEADLASEALDTIAERETGKVLQL
jgi:hypothetical protein